MSCFFNYLRGAKSEKILKVTCQKLHMLTTSCTELLKLDDFDHRLNILSQLNERETYISISHLVDHDLRTANVFGRLCLPQMGVVVLKAVFLNTIGIFIMINDVPADRVVKCHGFGRLIHVKMFACWGKKF